MAENIKEIFKIAKNINPENVGLYMLFKVRPDYDKPKWKVLQVPTKESASKDILKIVNDFF